MTSSPWWDFLFWGSLLLGAFAVIRALGQDGNASKSKREAALQVRLSRYPASARAVIIRGRPVAVWKLALYIALSVGLVWGMPRLQTPGTLGWLCEQVGAAQLSHGLLFLFFPGLPIVLTLCTVPLVVQSIRILQGGYAPPLASVLAHDTIAVSGWRATLQGVAGLIIMPVLLGGTGLVAYQVKQSFETSDAQRVIATRC